MTPLADLFQRTWYCGVFASGFHNGCRCDPDEPHGGWGCDWYWQAPPLTDEQARKYGLGKEET